MTSPRPRNRPTGAAAWLCALATALATAPVTALAPALPAQRSPSESAAAAPAAPRSATPPRIARPALEFVRFDELDCAVLDIAEDRSGALWFATRNGVWRSVGARAVAVDLAETPAPPVQALLCDASGAMWVATTRGPRRIDAATGSVQRVALPIPEHRHSMVACLADDPRGRVWLGAKAGLFRVDRAGGPAVRVALGDLDGAARALHCSAETGAMLVGTDHGVLRIDLRTDAVALLAGELGPVHTIVADRPGSAWVGTGRGLLQVDCRTGALAPIALAAGGRSARQIADVMVDRERRVWVADTSGALFVRDADGTRTHSFCARSVEGDRLRARPLALHADRTGQVWIGTRGGVFCVDPRPLAFDWLDVPRDLGAGAANASMPHCAWRDADGTTWVGTTAGEVLRRDAAGRWDCLGALTGPERTGVITDIRRDALGRMWIAHFRGGVWRVPADGHDAVHFDLAGDEAAWRITTDAGGGAWIAGKTDHAVRIEPDSSRRRVPCADGRVRQVHCDPVGGVWAATDGHGLARWDRDADRFDACEVAIAGGVIAIAQTGPRRLWLSAREGLLCFDVASGRLAPTAPGSPMLREELGEFVATPDGSLWSRSRGRLLRIDPERGGLLAWPPAPDGALADFCGPLAWLPDGRVWIAADRGFLRFDPGSFLSADVPECVQLVSARVQGRDVALARFDGAPHEIHVAPGEHHATFEVAVPGGRSSGVAQFAFSLGEGSDWIETGTRGTLDFGNLAGGDHLLRVKVTNGAGVWSEPFVLAAVGVEPVFWRTRWFLVLCVAVLTLLAFLAPWLRARAIARHNVRLAHLVGERTAELAERTTMLRQIGEVVHELNASRDLRHLLQVALYRVLAIGGASRGRALILEHGSGTLRLRESCGWPRLGSEPCAIPPHAMRDCLLAGAPLGEGIVRLLRDPCSPGGGDDERPRETIALRIDLEHVDEAVVLLDFAAGDPRFDGVARAALEQLRQPIASVLIKARMLEELTLLNQLKSDLMGSTAHDLRNPLTAVKATASLLADSLATGSFDKAEATADLENVQRAAATMATRLNELVDATSLEAGRVRLQPRLQDPREPMRAMIRLYEGAARLKNVVLRVRESEAIPQVVFDRNRIATVMDNLISNAIKFTEPGGEVEVSWEVRADAVVVHVSDTGVGLRPDEVDSAFLTPRRLSSKPTGGEPSSGLGLWIVRRVVEMHGGAVWLRSVQGRGSTFSFSLPLASPLAANE